MSKYSVTIRDIAREIGMSEATVSLALNGNTAVKNDTRELVRQTAEKMGYVPNTNARRLVMKRSGVIGIVVPEIENVYYAVLVRELTSYMAEAGYSLSIFISSNDSENELRAVSDMIAARVEGIIYVPINTTASNERTLELLERSGIPTICMTTIVPNMNSVMCDLEGGMQMLAEYLLKKNPTYIIYLSGPAGVYTLDCRCNAFLRSFDHTGIRTEVRNLGLVDYTVAHEEAKTFLGDLPDIIVCANDFMALGVVNLFTEVGISVPGDILVAGFDDSIFSVASPVPLTTVRQDLRQMAKETTTVLLEMISSSGVLRSIRIPTELIVRKSTERTQIN